MDINHYEINLREIANWKQLKKIYNSCKHKDQRGYSIQENPDDKECFNCILSALKGIFIPGEDSDREGREELFSVCFLLDHDNVGYHPPIETINRLILLLEK